MGDKNDKFEDVAKELGCDESEDALDKAMAGLKVEVEPEPEKGSIEEEK